ERPPRGVSAEQVEAARALGVPVQITNTLGMKLNFIPLGTAPFYLGVHEVTQADYDKVMRTNPSDRQGGNGGGPNHPVAMVSCEAADAFCKSLGALPEEAKALRRYRLPREDEWEHACRAGTRTTFYFGDDRALLPKYEWVPPRLDDFTTKPVGSLLPNP